MAYSKIERRTWNDERFRRWPKRRRDMWLYLLTTPHLDQAGGRIGCFVLDPLYATADLSAPDDRWTPEEVEEQLAALEVEGRILWDPVARLVLLCNFFRHNRPENPNVALAAARDVDEIPFSVTLSKGLILAVQEHLPNAFDGGKPLGSAIIDAVRARMAREGFAECDEESNALSDAEINGSERVPETLPEGLGQPFPKHEHEHEQEQKTTSSPSARAEARGLEELKEYLGQHAAAADRFATSAAHSPLWPAAVLGLYGPSGTDELVWKRSPPDRRPALLAVAIDRYAGEGAEYNGRYFRRFVEAVVEEQNGDGPAKGSSGGKGKDRGPRGRASPPKFDYSNAAKAGEKIEWPK